MSSSSLDSSSPGFPTKKTGLSLAKAQMKKTTVQWPEFFSFIGATSPDSLNSSNQETHEYRCTVCLRTFTDRFRYVSHLEGHKGNKYCSVCTQFVPFKRFRTHKNSHRVDAAGKPRLFDCPYCPKKYADNRRLSRHIRSHTGPHYRCTKCHRVFSCNTGSIHTHKCK